MTDAAFDELSDDTENAAVLRAADAWQVEGVGVWEAVKTQIAAETPEPVPVSAAALRRAQYETASDSPQIPSPALAAMIAHLEETQPTAVRETRAAANAVPTIDLTHHRAEPDAIAALPADTARENGALPMRKIGNKLWVAFAALPRIEAIDSVRGASRCQVIPLIATPPGTWEATFAAAYPAPPPAVVFVTPVAPSSDLSAELVRLVRDLQNEVSLLRREVQALKQAGADADRPRRFVPKPPALPQTRRTYPTPLFPLATPDDLFR